MKKRCFVKVVAIFMMAILMIESMVPYAKVNVQAAGTTLIEVTNDGAPIRDDNVNSGKVISKCEKGAVLTSTGVSINYKLSKWYKVKLPGSSKEYYIYSGNVKTHTHSYQEVKAFDVIFRICDCGTFETEAKKGHKLTPGEVTLQDTITYMGIAAIPATLDGPAPIGDLISFGLAASIAYLILVDSEASLETLQSLVDSIDFSKVEEEEKVCSQDEFRLVKRTKGVLVYANDTCYSIAEAYVLALVGMDVYTPNREVGLSCAALNLVWFEEIDCQHHDDYYWHFHLGYNDGVNRRDVDTKGHIFYGTTASGLTPT